MQNQKWPQVVTLYDGSKEPAVVEIFIVCRSCWENGNPVAERRAVVCDSEAERKERGYLKD